MPVPYPAGAGSDRPSRYRPDIDGLRAVAVGLVVAQHAALGPFPGGYIGVDVFFVISGYLITGLIADDLERGTFSFRSFYERRARRILPALLAMILVTTVFASLIMPPTELREYAKALPPSLLFYANTHMMRFGDYFGPNANDMPLLHLWSIAVEEQFYIVFPLLCVVVRRFMRRWLRPVVAVAALLLFVYAAQRMTVRPDQAYFATLTRVWELLLGAAVRLFPLPERWLRRGAAPLSWLGLGLIVACAVLYDDGSAVPGIMGLGPGLGAAAILAAGRLAPRGAGNLLAARPLVMLGRQSYSIYLWHWPVLVLAGFYFPDGTPAPVRVALVAATLAVAALSYRHVETPFRHVGGPMPLPRFAASLAAAMTVVALAFAGLLKTDGLASRLPETFPAVSALDQEMEVVVDCPDDPGDESEACTDDAAAPVLLIGDSHAGALSLGFSGPQAPAAVRLRLDHLANCPPVAVLPDPGLLRPERRSRRDCRRAAAARSAGWLANTDVKVVVMALFWRHYDDGGLGTPPAATPHDWIVAHVQSMAESLVRSGKKVVVVGPVPDYDQRIPVLLERNAIGLPATTLEKPRRQFDAETADIQAGLRRMATLPGIQVVFPHDVFCDAEVCRPVRDGRPLYSDDDHLSRDGAALVAPLVAAAVARLDATAALGGLKPAAAGGS